jgi:hypothetical protein
MQVFDDRFQAESGWNASCWLFKKKSITMHGNMNVKLLILSFIFDCKSMKSCLRSRLTNDMCAELSCHNRAQAKN